jgi:hypothetical protein
VPCTGPDGGPEKIVLHDGEQTPVTPVMGEKFWVDANRLPGPVSVSDHQGRNGVNASSTTTATKNAASKHARRLEGEAGAKDEPAGPGVPLTLPPKPFGRTPAAIAAPREVSPSLAHGEGGDKIARTDEGMLVTVGLSNVRVRRWPVLVAVLLLVSGGLLVVALVGGNVLGPSAPSSSGPIPWTAFGTGLATYDPADGYDLFLLVDGSTWTYGHGSWSNITSTAGNPSGMQTNSRLVYDARDGYILLYGGGSGLALSQPLNDSWKFQGGRWTNMTGTIRDTPPAMRLGPMAYDSEDQVVVLFGGTADNASGYPVASNETWTYAGGVWNNSTGPAPPPAGGTDGEDPFVALVNDPTDGYVLYFNALASARNPDLGASLWTYHAGVWTNQSAEFVPSPRLILFGGVTYDSTSGTIIAEAACLSTPTFSCQDPWGTFSFSGGHWKDVTPATATPPRELDGFVDDPSDGGVMMVGGCCWADFSGLSLGWQDAWVYSHGTWTESAPWGGGAPSWYENDGTWVGLGLTVIAAGTVVLALIGRRSYGP